MNGEQPGDGEDELAALRQRLADQGEEIAHLRRQLADQTFVDDLREALTLGTTAGLIVSPVGYTRLLEMIVETAAHVIAARAAALFLLDPAGQDLVFQVAIGGGGEAVKKFRVPLGHGIAGLVAVSGQPMLVSNADTDPRQATDIARAVGYAPQSILCVPLFLEDEVIGVLELLDKIDTPSFAVEDVQSLGLFANQAAVAIELSRTNQNLGVLLEEVVTSLGGLPEERRERLRQEAGDFITNMEDMDVRYRRALDLAQWVQQIAGHGDNEALACQKILRDFAEYLQSRPDMASLRGASG